MSYVHLRSSNFPNVHVRLDGTGVTHPLDNGGGIANCQYGAGPWETFTQISNSDGTVSFQSIAFPNVFLRMDGRGVTQPVGPGGGLVNGQYTAGPWEKFRIVNNDDGTYSLRSNQFANVFLRIDGTNVKQPSGPGAGTVNCQYGIGPYEKLAVCMALTDAQVNGALDKFTQWFPGQAQQINNNRQQILARCCPPFRTSAVPNVSKTPLYPTPMKLRTAGLTVCQAAILDVVVDVGTLALSILGIRFNNQEVRDALYYGLPGAQLNALQRYVEALRIAWNAGGRVRARAVVDLMNAIMSLTDFARAIWDYAYNRMSWWDWIVSGATIIAQLLAWGATEGVAAVAEVALLILSVVGLFNDLVKVKDACGLSTA